MLIGKFSTGADTALLRFALQVSFFIAMIFAVSLTAAAELKFDRYRINTGFVVRPPVLLARLDHSKLPFVLLQGDDAEHRQWLGIYRYQLDEFQQIAKLEVPAELLYFDTGDLDCSVGSEPDSDTSTEACAEGLYFLTPTGVVVWDLASAALRQVLEIPSAYHQTRSGRLRYQDFVRDINNDGLDDLVVPGHEGFRVYLHNGEGFTANGFLIPGSVQMKLTDDGVRYVHRQIYTEDLDGNERNDLFFLRDHQLYGFLQQQDGSFSTQVTQLQVPLDFLSEARMEDIDASRGEVDQSDLIYKQITGIEDIDGDGLLDIAIDATISEGMFDKHSQFDLHLGRRNGEAWLSYSPQPDTGVSSAGLLLDSEMVDLDGDGRKDLITSTVRISLMKVIGALFSGNVKVKFSFYRMGQDSTYPQEANYQSYSRVAFDLKTGHVKIPALVVADFDGDGRKDLMLQSDEGEISYYQGVAENRLFAKKARILKMDLPANGELVRSGDVNGDGKADLIIRYDSSDSVDKAQGITVMIAR